ncbi:MerR family transcriptional regulator [bacterium]|nr:MerR family transcriptional regulator [bacterium]MBU1989819.1 MerR family transcriptional regulator [bacterium]
MEYKISELVSLSNVPKSTILYYIKEGLLPEAKKLKSNVHRYSDEHVELIKYIKYMKEEIGSSNEHIKFALQNKNQSLSSSLSMLEPLMHTLSGIPENSEHYTKKQFVDRYDLDAEYLDKLIEDGILLPINENDFTDKELSILRLIEYFSEVGVEYEILRAYVYHAKALSTLEHQMQEKLCSVRDDKNFSSLWKIMFETLFNAKEYILNRHTYRVLLKALKNEISK